MHIILVQYCAQFWAKKRNASLWIKYANVMVLSDIYFPISTLLFCQHKGKLGLEKTLTFAYLMQFRTESIGKFRFIGTFFSIALAKFFA